MFKIIPSISILNSKCVRLEQGDYTRQTVYDESPVDFAKKFEDHGINKIHLIDLDGARSGHVINFDTLDTITSHTKLAVDFGGGIKTDGDLSKIFEYGASKATVGSLATRNRELFTDWLFSYGRNKLTLSADFYNEKVRVGGWQTDSEIDLIDHIDFYYQRGVQYVKCSDVSRDGLLKGPSIEIYKKLIKQFPLIKLVASGGISTLDDFKALEDIGAYGAIFGKAYYEGKISLNDLDKYIASITT